MVIVSPDDFAARCAPGGAHDRPTARRRVSRASTRAKSDGILTRTSRVALGARYGVGRFLSNSHRNTPAFPQSVGHVAARPMQRGPRALSVEHRAGVERVGRPAHPSRSRGVDEQSPDHEIGEKRTDRVGTAEADARAGSVPRRLTAVDPQPVLGGLVVREHGECAEPWVQCAELTARRCRAGSRRSPRRRAGPVRSSTGGTSQGRVRPAGGSR